MMERFDEAALIRINRCQIRKEVLTMADIIAGNGVHLQRDAHVYIPPVGGTMSHYDWVKEEPVSSDWTLWMHATLAVTSENRMLPFLTASGDGWLVLID